MKIKYITSIVVVFFALGLLQVPVLHAGQDSDLSFSPIIIVDSPQSKGGGKSLILQPRQALNADDLTTQDIGHHNTIQKGDFDEYAVALGATFHINDFLNVGAACGLPLNNEEPVQVDDVSIEAMITMQF